MRKEVNMKKRKLRILPYIAILSITSLLTGCRGNNFVNGDGDTYTEKDMHYFGSDKVKIEDISEIDIDTDYANVEVIASDGFYMEYQYYYIDNEPKLSIENGKLSFDDSGMNQGNYAISLEEDFYFKVYIPTGTEFSKVKIHNSSGEISLGNFTATELTIRDNYGDVIISGVNSKSADIDLDSGNLDMEECNLKEADISNSYGDVRLTSINNTVEDNELLGVMDIEIASGDLEINRLSSLSVDMTNSYGEISAEKLIVKRIDCVLSSGECKLTDIVADTVNIDSSYGDTTVVLQGKEEDYKLNIDTDFGSTTVGDHEYDGNVVIDKGGEKELDINASSGDVAVTFKD